MIGKSARMAVLVLLLASPGLAGEVRGTCDLRFLGTSTLHEFTGTVRCLPFAASLVKGANGTSAVPEVLVDVPVEGMETGNRSRDATMRSMFESDRFPRIRGTVRNVDIDAIRQAEGEGKAGLDLSLRIRDVERNVRAAVTHLREEGSEVRFDLEFPVSLKEFGLEAPTVLFFIRVGDRVTVKGNVRLEISSKE
jgi:YceI-like domain